MASFRLTREAIEDLDAIWLYIYKSNPRAADAVEGRDPVGLRIAR